MSVGPSADRPPARGGLTALDKRILAALPSRVSGLVRKLNRGLSSWSPQRTTEEEVLAILRGFEHLGQVDHVNGWWRRMDPMERERTE